MTSDTAELPATLPSRGRLAAAARATRHALTDLILPPQCLARCSRLVSAAYDRAAVLRAARHAFP